MKILYIDPIFGISGDMTISALLDAGMPFGEIERVLNKLPVNTPSVTPSKKTQGIIEGTLLTIDHSDIHLTPTEMKTVINTIDIPEKVRQDTLSMLDLLVTAEAKVHNVSADEIHFHELSHIDTIIDLLCVAFGIYYFGIEEVFCGPVPFGRGTVKTAHGVIPNPPPAAVELLKGFPVVFTDIPLELVTPTGAAILRHYVHKSGAVIPFRIEKTGYGAGNYESEKPDLLRIFIGDTDEVTCDEDIWVIEADVDDMNMEYTGAVLDKIREAGAMDALFFPVHMKKGRIGIRISVSTFAEKLDHVMEIIFSETTTFGVRFRKDARRVLRRGMKTIDTDYGPIRVKTGYDRDGFPVKHHIEFDDVKSIADRSDIPYKTILGYIKKTLSEE